MLKLNIQLQEPCPLSAQAHTAAPITALLGESASGKTTLLRTIAGLQHCYGTIYWHDKIINHQAPHKRLFTLVQQKPQLFPHWTIAQHITQVRKHACSNKLDAESLIKKIGLTDLLQKYPQQLSGGQQQRAALLLALLREPELLLLDEPFSALDRKAKHAIYPVLQEAIRILGAQVLLVSHQLQDCMALADAAWLLADGKIQWQGSVHEGIRRYGHGHTDYSLLQATFSHYDSDAHLSCYRLQDQWLYASGAHNTENQAPVRIALYADDIGISLSQPQGCSFVNCLQATITEMTQLEHHWRISCAIPSGIQTKDTLHPIKIQTININISHRSARELQLRTQQTVYLLAKAGAVDILSERELLNPLQPL